MMSPDNKVLCLERQCLKNLDQEVYLDDDEELTRKKRAKAGVTWSGDIIKKDNVKTYYDEVTLKLGPREKKIVPGTYLLITPDEQEHKSVPHYPCKVLYLYSRMFQGKKLDMAHVQWFARGENTILDIEHLPVEDVAKWRKLGGTRGAIMKEDAGG